LISVRAIPREIDRVQLLARIAVGNADAGRPLDARELMNEARALQHKAAVPGPEYAGWMAANEAFLVVADLHLGGLTVDSEAADTLTGDARNMFLAIQACRSVQHGRLERALNFLEAIDDVLLVDDVLKPLALARAKSGAFAAALADAKRITDHWHRNATLAELACLQAQNADARVAREILLEAQNDVTESWRRGAVALPGRSGYSDVARALCAVGAVEEALAWVEAEDAPASRTLILMGMADDLLRREGLKSPELANASSPAALFSF
jgi:hypothetical protein